MDKSFKEASWRDSQEYISEEGKMEWCPWFHVMGGCGCFELRLMFCFVVFFPFLMWTIFKVCIEFVTTLLVFYDLVFFGREDCDLSSLTGDLTCTPGIGRWSRNTGPPGKSPGWCLMQAASGLDREGRLGRGLWYPAPASRLSLSWNKQCLLPASSCSDLRASEAEIQPRGVQKPGWARS